MTRETSSRPVLLVGGDLNAAARVEAAARSVGIGYVAVRSGGFVDSMRKHDPSLVIVDLDEGGEPLLQAIRAELDSGPARSEVIGFFSHVDEGLGRRAAELGIKALPRGRFWRELAGLMTGAS